MTEVSINLELIRAILRKNKHSNNEVCFTSHLNTHTAPALKPTLMLTFQIQVIHWHNKVWRKFNQSKEEKIMTKYKGYTYIYIS